LPPPAAFESDADGSRLAARDSDPAYSLEVVLSRPAAVEGGRLVFSVGIEPRGEWQLRLSARPSTMARKQPQDGRPGRPPVLRAAGRELQQTFDRSLSDLACLRLSGGDLDGLTAAGAPWFMTVFGRDTIVTCLQTMMLGPERGERALRALGALQADSD